MISWLAWYPPDTTRVQHDSHIVDEISMEIVATGRFNWQAQSNEYGYKINIIMTPVFDIGIW